MSKRADFGKGTRFNTARQWIEASLDLNRAHLDSDIVDALAKCCRKRDGGAAGPLWGLRKTEPKGGAEYFAFKALKFASHAHRWGDLNCWGEGFTARLMEASDSERDLFDRAFDQLGKISAKRRARNDHR